MNLLPPSPKKHTSSSEVLDVASMATSDSILNMPEKGPVPGETDAAYDDIVKPESSEESGEVFQQAQYRALGW